MPFDPDTAIGGGEARFPSTRLSLMERASAGDALSHEVLQDIVSLYWKPIYKYIRCKWNKNNEDAKDLTQEFLVRALVREFFERFDPQLASFRTYLRMAVDRFVLKIHVASLRQKRGGGVGFMSLDRERVELQALERVESPETAFEREWQRQLFELAIEDFRGCCELAGKMTQFRIFEQYDLAEGERPSYAELAELHCIPATSVTNHLAWARRTLREFVSERLRGVTSGERELRAEMRSAFRAGS